jgi:hypothetical protein
LYDFDANVPDSGHLAARVLFSEPLPFYAFVRRSEIIVTEMQNLIDIENPAVVEEAYRGGREAEGGGLLV